jgi:hypothetical protein
MWIAPGTGILPDRRDIQGGADAAVRELGLAADRQDTFA